MTPASFWDAGTASAEAAIVKDVGRVKGMAIRKGGEFSAIKNLGTEKSLQAWQPWSAVVSQCGQLEGWL